MADIETRKATSESQKQQDKQTVPGFSERFNSIIRKAELAPPDGKINYSLIAKRFDKVPNTIKNWCFKNSPPRVYGELKEVVESLLSEIPGDYNINAVIGWLYGGDAVPNPFGDKGKDLLDSEIYLLMYEIAKKNGVDFDAIPETARQKIQFKAVSKFHSGDRSKKPRDNEDVIYLISMLLEMFET